VGPRKMGAVPLRLGPGQPVAIFSAGSMSNRRRLKIISGGQSGADRAALDAAINLGVEYGGWIPRARKAEDGPLDPSYNKLMEIDSDSYADRTEQNVIGGDGTLIFTTGTPTGGTAYTIECARVHGKPHLVVYLRGKSDEKAIGRIEDWLATIRPKVLNVAGPRESKSPGIYKRVLQIMTQVLTSSPTLCGRPHRQK
jgi:hypothetical protein